MSYPGFNHVQNLKRKLVIDILLLSEQWSMIQEMFAIFSVILELHACL